MKERGDPLFPLHLCQAMRSESFSPPLFAALCSPDLLVAAQRIATYKRLIAPMRLDATREARARHYLATTVLPATDLAFLLGFDEPTSCYRAFRTWTGATPESVRRLPVSAA